MSSTRTAGPSVWPRSTAWIDGDDSVGEVGHERLLLRSFDHSSDRHGELRSDRRVEVDTLGGRT